jgi:hypothetical protein
LIGYLMACYFEFVHKAFESVMGALAVLFHLLLVVQVQGCQLRC